MLRKRSFASSRDASMNFSEWELDFVSSRACLGTGDDVVARNCTGYALIEFRTRVVSFVLRCAF